MDSAEILFCLLDSLDNCDLATEASVYSTVVDFAKSTTTSPNCVGLVSNAIISFLQVSHTSVNHQLSLLRLLSLIISSYAISDDFLPERGENGEVVNKLEIVNATNFTINEISQEDIEFFDNLSKFIINEYACLKQTDPRRVALLQVLISLVFLIPEKLVENLLGVIDDTRINNTGGISSVLIAISAISRIFPEIISKKGHDIIVELLSLLHRVAKNDSSSKNAFVNNISRVELVRCLADVADALRSNYVERKSFAGLVGTAFDALLNDWVPTIQKDKDAFYLSFPTLETLGHLAQVIDDEQLIQNAPKLLSIYLQILNSLLSKKNKYFPTLLATFSEPCKNTGVEFDDLLPNNIYTLRWRQYYSISASATSPLLTNKSETIALSLHYSILSGFKLFLDRCHTICPSIFEDQNANNSLFNVLIQYCAIFHRLYAPAILPGYIAHLSIDTEVVIEKEMFESENGYLSFCWNYPAIHDIVTTNYELILCWKSLIKQDITRETALKFLFENIDIKSANRLSSMFIFRHIIVDLPFEKVSRHDDQVISICETSNTALGNLLYRLARTTLEQGLDYCIAFILSEIICELAKHKFLHIGSHEKFDSFDNNDDITESTCHKYVWVSPSPSSAEMLTYFLRLLAVPESKAKSEHIRHIQRHKNDYLKNNQNNEDIQMPVIYPPSLLDLRNNAQHILSAELTSLVPDLLWPLLIDAVNHLKLGSAMPIVCESLCKSCNNLYQRSSPEIFFSAFKHQSTQYLSVSDPYKIFVWLCMYAHDPYIYNGVLAYWSLKCLKWISPMIMSSPYYIWSCLPSQRLQTVIEIAESVILPSKMDNCDPLECDSSDSRTIKEKQTCNTMCNSISLPYSINIDLWFTLVDECISLLLSGMSDLISETNSDVCDLVKGQNEEVAKSKVISFNLMGVLSAIFSACKDIRSDKIQKHSDTPTEFQRAGMYSLLGLLIREINKHEPRSISEGFSELKIIEKFIINVLDAILIPDLVTYPDSTISGTVSSGSNINNSLVKIGGDFKDIHSSNDLLFLKELSKHVSDIQHFFHAIGLSTCALQASCGRGLGYASSNSNNFVLILEYLLELIKSDSANKRSGAFSFFGKSLAVLQAEQLRSALILSLGHAIGETNISLFSSSIETIQKILVIFESAIKEEKEQLLHCSTLRAIQVAFSAFSLVENNEITLSSRINSALNRSHSGDGFGVLGEYLNLEDSSIELFNSFRDTIFPYILTIMVFSETMELPPVPLDSTLLLKAASGMPYNTSSSISSQRIHTDPSGPYIRSMVRYRDISISNLDLLSIIDSDLSGDISGDEMIQNEMPSMKINQKSGSGSIGKDNLLFGPFNLTLAVLSVLSENPLMSSENASDIFMADDLLKQLGNNRLSNISFKDIVSNLRYIKADNGIFGINNRGGFRSCNIELDSRSNILDSSSSESNLYKKISKVKSNLSMKGTDITNEVARQCNFRENSSQIDEGSESSVIQKETKTTELNSNRRVSSSNSSGSSNVNQNNKNQSSTLASQSVSSIIPSPIIPVASASVSSFPVPNNNSNSFTQCSNNSSSGTNNTNNMNNANNNNASSTPVNIITFNNLLLHALETSISLISFPCPLIPQQIPLVTNSCLTILVSVSSRIKFRHINEDLLSIINSKYYSVNNSTHESHKIMDGGFKLKHMMSIIEDVLTPTSQNEVSAFKILDSLDRLYLNIYKSHMSSWVGLSHLLEGLLGLGATANSPVLRCLCIHVTYCLVREAPLVEILQQGQLNFKDATTNSSDVCLPPKGTWVSWMHCVALILGRTCDSCIYVRLIAFECIKECMKRCIWTQCVDISQIKAFEFEEEMAETLKSDNNGQLRAALRGNIERFSDGSNRNKLFIDRDNHLSDVQSIILPNSYLNLLFTLANSIPAFCLRPLCQHILPSFHDVDKVTAYSSVETVRIFFIINKQILESESFSSRIISSLFDEISAIDDNELQHIIYLLIRNVVSRQFQSGINEIFNKCIQPQRYIHFGYRGVNNKHEYVENVIINNSGGGKSEWTAVDVIESGNDSTLRQLNKSLHRDDIRDVLNLICTVNPIYSKAISYIGREKSLLVESFRYLTDILNNTEQKYSDIVEMNEKLCMKIASLNNSSSNGLFTGFLNPVQGSFPHKMSNLYSINVNNTSGIHPFSTCKGQFVPMSTLSSLSNEHIYLRSSTLAIDILLQTNDSSIKVIAKKHFPELVSTLLLRCCSTLGYINMGALESSSALRSLFLALYDFDTFLTFFDVNQLELSLTKPDEFDSAIMKLLCHIFVQKPNISKSIFSFVRPFLNRVNSIYCMGALMLLSPIPLGIYIDDFSGSTKNENSGESTSFYDSGLLDSILNIIQMSSNPYAKKSGFIFFQWYFWYCLESNRFPNTEFISKFINVCFINVIGNSMFKNDIIRSGDFRAPLKICKINNSENSMSLDSYDLSESEIYETVDTFLNDNDTKESIYREKGCSEDENGLGILYTVIRDDQKHDKIGDSKDSCSPTHSDKKSTYFEPRVKENQMKRKVTAMMINRKSIVGDLIRECLISLRYLICIISKIDFGLPLVFIPNHPPINLDFDGNNTNTNTTHSTLFIKYIFSDKISDSKVQSYKQGFQDFKEDTKNVISEIFMDFITNSDFDIQITTEKLYLLLDILILIRKKWDISKPDKEEMDLIILYLKKLLIPLLVRLEEPVLKLTRPVWRAIQLILSIILTDYEWDRVINEIQKRFILDGLMTQNSLNSPLSMTVSPSSLNNGRTCKTVSGNVDKFCYSETNKKKDNRLQLDERFNTGVKYVEFISSPYCDSANNYKFILPINYRKNVDNFGDCCLTSTSSEDTPNLNSHNRFIQVKYSGECEFLNRFLFPILNPAESNNYQQFLNCIVPFIISSDVLRVASNHLRDAYSLSKYRIDGDSNNDINEVWSLDTELILGEGNLVEKLDVIKPNLEELRKRIEDCHLYLNRCRYYFPKELWEITETAFSTIPKELDRIKKEAETQHLLFNRNIFGEMVNGGIYSNEEMSGNVFNRGFLNNSDFPSNPSLIESSGNRFSISYSPSSGVISIPSFAKVALARFNTLWRAGRGIEDNKDLSNSYGNSNDITLNANSHYESAVENNFEIRNKNIGSDVDLNNIEYNEINGCKLSSPVDTNKIQSLNKKPAIKGKKLPDALSQQLEIKKMELISEYIRYPATLKTLEKYHEGNEGRKVAIEGASAILASTFIKYISIEFFQHLYTSEILMLLAYREVSSFVDFGVDNNINELEKEDILENEVLMITIDRLLSLESLISAICKQISSFVAHSQSPSRHKFAKALANLVYISYKP